MHHAVLATCLGRGDLPLRIQLFGAASVVGRQIQGTDTVAASVLAVERQVALCALLLVVKLRHEVRQGGRVARTEVLWRRRVQQLARSRLHSRLADGRRQSGIEGGCRRLPERQSRLNLGQIAPPLASSMEAFGRLVFISFKGRRVIYLLSPLAYMLIVLVLRAKRYVVKAVGRQGRHIEHVLWPNKLARLRTLTPCIEGVLDSDVPVAAREMVVALLILVGAPVSEVMQVYRRVGRQTVLVVVYIAGMRLHRRLIFLPIATPCLLLLLSVAYMILLVSQRVLAVLPALRPLVVSLLMCRVKVV